MSTLTAVYDLAVSPPTYDFISFICSAEQWRKDNAHKDMDVVFSPGPKNGFRNDNLPPEDFEREGMLWRVCVGITRLLPSVRNVYVQKSRYKVSGHLFPKGWREEFPQSHYGTYLLKTAPRCLTATEVARRYVKNKYHIPYVTMTLRESKHWMGRNSNIQAWEGAAEQIQKMGYEVVWVPDTYSEDAIPESWDVDLRAALYQGAVCNLGVSSGQLCIAVFTDSPYLMFRILAPGCPSTSKEFLESHGLKVGDQLTPNGKLIWENETEGLIVKEFKSFLERAA